MVFVNVSNQTRLSALEKLLAREQKIAIGKGGKPVAILTRFDASLEDRRPGALRGEINISDDFDTLPNDIAHAFGVTE